MIGSNDVIGSHGDQAMRARNSMLVRHLVEPGNVEAVFCRWRNDEPTILP